MHVSHGMMTTNTGKTARAIRFGIDRMDDLRVAVSAGRLRDRPIPWCDLDRLVKPARRERQRMIPAIEPLGKVLAEEMVRRMAIVAGCHSVVTGFRPRLELLVHDVAIRARGRAIKQVRSSFGIHECKRADADDKTNQCDEPDRGGVYPLVAMRFPLDSTTPKAAPALGLALSLPARPRVGQVAAGNDA